MRKKKWEKIQWKSETATKKVKNKMKRRKDELPVKKNRKTWLQNKQEKDIVI